MDSTTALVASAAALAAAVLAVAVVVLVRLVRTRRELRRTRLPTGPRWIFWGAVFYFVLPTDLLPDPVYLDDIGVLLLALRGLRGSHTRCRGGANSPATTERKETNHPFDSYK
ncbi:YkvA family protein [Streptomyces sp. NPDC051207]|uniref:YkvA family protein n=1 Tax=Streptomyces sp. NPDC051207 TaxID=3154641 RepID=UPI00342F09D5